MWVLLLIFNLDDEQRFKNDLKMGPLQCLSEWTNETIGCGDGGTFKKGDNTMEKPTSS